MQEELQRAVRGCVKTSALTLVALVAFALNSLLCRLALGGDADAATFTSMRLGSGAAALLLLTSLFDKGSSSRVRGNWVSSALLFSYAAAFSFAYLGLGAATGALVLFASVQLTMIVAALRAGERLRAWQWAGLFVALSGLAYLVAPGLAAPPPSSAALMFVAGVSWGLYSLRGRGSSNPLADTAGNFVRALPFAAALSLLSLGGARASARGLALASVSGALASGAGYVVWYAALGGLTAARAAAVQLAVPVLAAAGGVLLLAEAVTLRLVLSSALVLGGVALALSGRTSGARR